MRGKYQYLILLILLAFMSGCSDESISEVPNITFISIDPETLITAQEIVTIRISYIDGNGDLGENDANVKNLFVTDSRNEVRYTFRIPALAPEESNITITGELPIEIANVMTEENSATFDVTFDIQGQEIAAKFKGVVDGDDLTGEFVTDFGNATVTGSRSN